MPLILMLLLLLPRETIVGRNRRRRFRRMCVTKKITPSLKTYGGIRCTGSVLRGLSGLFYC